MHSVVAARMDLPDIAVGPELGRHVEDRVELMGQDIVAGQARTLVDVELRGKRGAPVPALAGGPAQRARLLEEGADHGHLVRALVVAEQRGPGAATSPI